MSKLIHEKSKVKELSDGVMVKEIFNCARCGGSHEHVKFNRFTYPIVDDNEDTWEYWAMCPVVNEPIIMMRVKDLK